MPVIELNEDEWLGAIEDRYGVRLREGTRPYADLHKGKYVVYAGSEYVATLGGSDGKSKDPNDAKDWADNLGHMPLGGKGVESAKKIQIYRGHGYR